MNNFIRRTVMLLLALSMLPFQKCGADQASAMSSICQEQTASLIAKNTNLHTAFLEVEGLIITQTAEEEGVINEFVRYDESTLEPYRVLCENNKGAYAAVNVRTRCRGWVGNTDEPDYEVELIVTSRPRCY